MYCSPWVSRPSARAPACVFRWVLQIMKSRWTRSSKPLPPPSRSCESFHPPTPVSDQTTSESPVAVAMSGGVDSSVVAGLLQRQGQPIVGLTMQLWNQRRLPELAPEGGVTGRCCSLDDVYDARQVAQHLGIPYYVVNFESGFEEQVVKPFIDDYLSGRTPIPCTLC